MNRRFGEDKVISEDNEEQSHLDAESNEVACDGSEWHDEAWEIHLAEHVRVFDECLACLIQAFRKVSPKADACEVKERLREPVGADFGDAAEHDHEHDCGHDGLDNEPQWSENGLLVPSDDVALYEHAVKIAILPKLPKINREQACLGLDNCGPFA